MLYVCFVLLSPAVACLLYRWLLATIAGIGTVLLSHYLIRDHFVHLWGTSSFRPLIETQLVALSTCVTGLLAVSISGVNKPIRLVPLLLLPTPILLYRIKVMSITRNESVAIEYYLYGFTLFALLPAICESFIEFLNQTRAILVRYNRKLPELRSHTTLRAPISAINEQRVRRAADKTVLAAAIFMFCLLLVNLVLASLWPQVTPVNSTATAPANTANAPVPNNTKISAYAPQLTTGATTMFVSTSPLVSTASLVSDTKGTYSQNSTRTDKWSFGRSFAFSISLLFESPVTLFTAASLLAVPLYALLVAFDEIHKRLSPVPEFHIRSSFVQHMRHVRRLDVGVSDLSTTVAYMLLALVCYGFTNCSLNSLERAERVERLLYLPIWLATCAVRLLCSALGFQLQTLPYETGRKRSIGLFVNVSLHVLLQALCIFFIRLCWPQGSMPFWQYFWAVVIVPNAVTSVFYSALRISSTLFTVYLKCVLYKEIEAILLGIKLLWMLVLIVISLWLLALAVANEWNALTLVALIGFVVSQGFSAGRIAIGLWIECRVAARSNCPQITEDSDPLFFRDVRANVRPECCLCRCSITQEQIDEQQIERSVCEEWPHYFHAACFRMWSIDHSMCPICRETQQHSRVRLIDYIATAVRWLWNVVLESQRVHIRPVYVPFRSSDSLIGRITAAVTRAEGHSHGTSHTDNL